MRLSPLSALLWPQQLEPKCTVYAVWPTGVLVLAPLHTSCDLGASNFPLLTLKFLIVKTDITCPPRLRVFNCDH